MTTEQRRALAGKTPTAEVIKDAVTFPRDRLGEPLDISPERFEAWLRSVRRDAAREALDELIAWHRANAQDTETPAPIRRGIAVMADEAQRYRDTHYPEPCGTVTPPDAG